MSEILLPIQIPPAVKPEWYELPVTFLNEEGFIPRMDQEFKKIFNTGTDPEKIKDELNYVFLSILNSDLDEKYISAAHIIMLSVLCDFAQKYKREATYKNIFDCIKNPEYAEICRKYYFHKALIVYGKAYFMVYQHAKSINNSIGNLDLLMIAKANLWKAYLLHIEGKVQFGIQMITECLSLLSMCMADLSRWDEGMHYLNVAARTKDNNPNITYAKVLLLDAFRDKTCNGYNTYLLKKIIDFSEETISGGLAMPEQITQLNGFIDACKNQIATKDITLQKLNEHDKKVAKISAEHDAYTSFCLDNGLFLNEHSIFCRCNDATVDSIKIQTEHKHTEVEKAILMEPIVSALVADFIHTRKNLFDSMDVSVFSSYHKNDLRRINIDFELQCAMLRNAFKNMYGILDKIARGILQVMNQKIGDEERIYFNNIWNKFPDSDYKNFYLTSLRSIHLDLGYVPEAALQDFKRLRNEIEHKLLVVVRDRSEIESMPEFVTMVITKDELFEKTKILMQLTKSAIHSFVYLVRRQTKLEEKSN